MKFVVCVLFRPLALLYSFTARVHRILRLTTISSFFSKSNTDKMDHCRAFWVICVIEMVLLHGLLVLAAATEAMDHFRSQLQIRFWHIFVWFVEDILAVVVTQGIYYITTIQHA